MNYLLKVLIFFQVLIQTPLVYAEAVSWKNQKIKCEKEFVNYLKDNSIDLEKSRQILANNYDEIAYRIESREIGCWSDIHLRENDYPTITNLENDNLTQLTFNEKCEIVSFNISMSPYLTSVFQKSAKENWNNKQLKKLIEENKFGIIYSWSPKFVYSVLELPRIEQLARQLGYKFTAVVDPRVSREEVLESLKKIPKTNVSIKRVIANTNSMFNRNISSDLYMRGGFDHFPVIYVYGNKKIHPQWITGVMTDGGFNDLITTYSLELK